MAEWTNAPVSKTGWGETPSQVQILYPPPSPRRSFSEVGLRQIYAWLRRDKVRFQHDEVLTKSVLSNFMYYVYSLKCKSGYYVGCTDNLEDRIDRHQKGHVPATAKHLPIKLDFYIAIENKYKAFEFEKYLKSGSGRAFINKHLS